MDEASGLCVKGSGFYSRHDFCCFALTLCCVVGNSKEGETLSVVVGIDSLPRRLARNQFAQAGFRRLPAKAASHDLGLPNKAPRPLRLSWSGLANGRFGVEPKREEGKHMQNGKLSAWSPVLTLSSLRALTQASLALPPPLLSSLPQRDAHCVGRASAANLLLARGKDDSLTQREREEEERRIARRPPSPSISESEARAATGWGRQQTTATAAAAAAAAATAAASAAATAAAVPVTGACKEWEFSGRHRWSGSKQKARVNEVPASR